MVRRGPPSNWQVWQDRDVARLFTEGRRAAVIGADAQMEVLLRLVACIRRPEIAVLDLGCGDAVLLHAIMRERAVAHGVAVDGSPAMLEKAQVRFEDLGLFGSLVEFVEADFGSSDWLSCLPREEFDLVVTGFAVHHCEDERKRELYEELYRLLLPGGLLVNIEHVASATPLGEELFEAAYADNLFRHRRSRGEQTSLEAVRDELRNRRDKAANRLAPMETQLRWLREIGFRDVDCYWKLYELAVMAGFRPDSDAPGQAETGRPSDFPG